jgi:hypothetical protein
LRRLLDEEGSKGRSIWANFNLSERVNLDAILKQQEQLAQFAEDNKSLVVKTTALERVTDEWPGSLLRGVELIHSGVVWVSESGLAFRRVVPLTTS